jgi:DNA-binding NarL/FixJ family response regulator
MTKSSMSPVISKSARVWLVEDNDSFRNALARTINKHDDLVCQREFSSCEDALAALATESAPEVILLDVRLPGMSGIDGIKRFKEAAANTRIVMLTMFDDHDKVFKSICAGASGYLLKTASKDKIAEAIHEALEGGAPMNAQIARMVLDRFSQMVAPKNDYNLTEREEEVLKLMVRGLIKKEIADALAVSYHTIDTHLRHIYQKMRVHNRTGAVAKAVKKGLFPE